MCIAGTTGEKHTCIAHFAVLCQGVIQYSNQNYITSIENIPYHVLIVYDSWYCSGTLIRSRIVVTAASCFEQRKQNESVIVKVGSSKVTDLGQVIEVLEVKNHEYYGYHMNKNNDISILMLKEHVIFGPNVKKIMVDPEMDFQENTMLNVSGWGSTTNLDVKYLNYLIWSKMILINNDECKKVHHNLITLSNFCVKYLPERRLSDNGGPAAFDQWLVGIVSFGATNVYEPHVAVLTNVSYFYKWITLNADRFMNKYCKASHHAKPTADIDLENLGTG